jgi:Ca2+-binding EF-hand superfamily protein
MGNIVNGSLLDQPVSQALLFLSNCNLQPGTSSQISSFCKSYSSTKQSGSYYISLIQLKQITRQTPLFSFEESLFKYFKTTSMRVNMMEILASIITYSSAPWKEKLKLAFLLFDFDNSQQLNEAEMAIMIISFFKGISTMTASVLNENLDLEPIGKQCFDLASNKNGGISTEDLINWVSATPEILKLLCKNEAKNPRSKKYSRKKSIFDRNFIRFSIFNQSRRASSYRSSSLPNQMQKFEWKNKASDLSKLQEMFFKHMDDKGSSPVGKIYQELMEDKRFQKDIEFFFHEFDFDLNRRVEFSQLVEYIEKVKSKQGYFFLRGKEKVYPIRNKNLKKNTRKSINLEVLRLMFQSFDSNKDGFLSFQEFHEGLKKNFDKQTIVEVFQTYDGDKNKLIDFSEFIKVFSPERIEEFSR